MKKAKLLLSLMLTASVVALAACDTTTSTPTPSTPNPTTPATSAVVPNPTTPAPTTSVVNPTAPTPISSVVNPTTPTPISSVVNPTTPIPPSPTSTTPVVSVSVAISGTDHEMEKGDTQTLTATVTGTSNTTVTWTSSNAAVITVTEGGLVTVVGDVTEDTNVTITATSVADSTKTDSFVITVKAPVAPVKQMTVGVTLTNFNEETPLESIIEGTGAYKLRLNIENLPDGKTLADCTVALPKSNAYGTFSQIEQDVTNHMITYTAMNAGDHNFDIVVTCGETVVTKNYTIKVARNDSIYTEINTVDEFMSMITQTGSITGKYILKANLDLGGAVISHAAGDVFNGVLNGDGHTVSNYVVKDEVGLLPVMAQGIVSNLHLDGTIDASGNGWAGLLSKEIGNMSIVSNCLFVGVNAGAANSNWSNRNGIIAACVKGVVENVVSVNATDNAADGTVLYQTFSTFFAASKVDNTSLKNIYTNMDKDPWGNNVSLPACTDASWQIADNDPIYDNVTRGLGDFSTSTVADFALPTDVWTLVDGKMPVLAHYGEEAAVAVPELSVSSTSAKVEVGKTKDITVSSKNFSVNPVITLEGDEGYESIVEITNVSNVYTIKGLAVGTTNIKFKASENGIDYFTSTVAITVEAAGEEGNYDIPEGAVEITTAQAFIDFFSDTNKINNKETSIYLSSDLDFAGITIPMLSIGIDYLGTIEGQGNSLDNIKLTQGDALFHFFGGTIRNLDINIESTIHPGSGLIAYSNTGTMENLNVTVTLGATNTVGLALTSGTSQGTPGNPVYKNIHVDYVFTAVGSNTIYPVCQNDGAENITIENCTYSLKGDVVTDPTGIFVTSNANITYVA